MLGKLPQHLLMEVNSIAIQSPRGRSIDPLPLLVPCPAGWCFRVGIRTLTRSLPHPLMAGSPFKANRVSGLTNAITRHTLATAPAHCLVAPPRRSPRQSRKVLERRTKRNIPPTLYDNSGHPQNFGEFPTFRQNHFLTSGCTLSGAHLTVGPCGVTLAHPCGLGARQHLSPPHSLCWG